MYRRFARRRPPPRRVAVDSTGFSHPFRWRVALRAPQKDMEATLHRPPRRGGHRHPHGPRSTGQRTSRWGRETVRATAEAGASPVTGVRLCRQGVHLPEERPVRPRPGCLSRHRAREWAGKHSPWTSRVQGVGEGIPGRPRVLEAGAQVRTEKPAGYSLQHDETSVHGMLEFARRGGAGA